MKDIETKDDPEFKFDDDDDDDSMLAAVLPDSVTKPTENPSSAGAFAVLGNPAQRLPHSTQTDPNSSQASQLPLQPQVNTDQSPGQSGHIPDASTPVQRQPPATETNPNSSQASQVLVQPQVNTDQSPGQSGHTPAAGTCFQDLFREGKNWDIFINSTFSLFNFSVLCKKTIISPKEDISLKP